MLYHFKQSIIRRYVIYLLHAVANRKSPESENVYDDLCVKVYTPFRDVIDIV